jgi:hypothetical protein
MNILEEKFFPVKQEPQYGDFGSHCMLNVESSVFIMMMEWSMSLSDDNAPSNMC